jgi:uncharacterized protein YbjT (DUF2867 family)
MRGKPVRALVRTTSNPSAVARLRDLGVEFAVGDLKDPASLQPACRGAHTVISTASVTHSRQDGDSIESADESGQVNLVRAAAAQRVKRFIYISFTGAIRSDDPLTRAKRRVESAIQESGMTYTILRPSYFMESWLGPGLGFDFANAKARIYGSGNEKVSFIARGDVAAFAVASVDNASTENAVLEIGGPEPVSPLEAVKIFEEIGGRRFEVQHVAEDAIREQGASATDSLQKSFAALMLQFAQGDPIPMEDVLKQIPVELTSVRQYAASALGKV